MRECLEWNHFQYKKIRDYPWHERLFRYKYTVIANAWTMVRELSPVMVSVENGYMPNVSTLLFIGTKNGCAITV